MNRIARYGIVIILLILCGCTSRHGSPEAKVATEEEPSAQQGVKRKQIVKLTPAAIAMVHKAQREENKTYLRVSVVSGETIGFMYDMKFDNEFNPESDFLDNSGGIKVVVDMRSSLFLEGATIDWQTTPDGRQGFHFDNPNAVK